ncbi:fumarate reductase subunit C [Enterobacter cloacae S611]|uniref:Fumarate reductase subunit C n=1 Tax=Enterobacter cloacae S611 TaxID=1399146 RepID=A0ABN0QCP6_ENTCL|nr:fumarate reductase subunit C [Enterobacter cloacae S611]
MSTISVSLFQGRLGLIAMKKSPGWQKLPPPFGRKVQKPFCRFTMAGAWWSRN